MEKAYKLEFQTQQGSALAVSSCGLSKTEPLHSFGPAIKPNYLIHYVLSGRGNLSFSGKEYPLEAGYGFLIVPDEVVFYQADETDPWTYVWVGFGGNMAEEYLSNIGLSLQNPIFKSDQSDLIYQTVVDMMEHNTYGIANELRRNGQLGIFLSILAESAPMAEKSETDRANAYVRRAVEFVQNNYYNPIKITDIADYVCINRSYLYTLFQKSMDMSPQKFLTTFRITKATELLQLTTLPIESIAISCGYSDPLVFTKAFRQMKKMSPSAYRKEITSGENRRNKAYLKEVEAFIAQIKEITS